jgi:hypothetical protein
VLALLQQTRTRGSADLAAVLAGRGILQSGALVGGEQRLLEGFQSGQASAAQQLLDALGGYEATYGSTMSELERQRLQAAKDAALLAAQMNPPTWNEPTTTTTTETLPGSAAGSPGGPAAIPGYEPIPTPPYVGLPGLSMPAYTYPGLPTYTEPYVGPALPPAPVAPADIPANYPADIYWNPATDVYQATPPARGGGRWAV